MSEEKVKVKILHSSYGKGVKEVDKEKAAKLVSRGIATYKVDGELLVGGFTQADIDAAYEKGKAEALEGAGEFIVNEEAVKKFLTDTVETATGENIRSDCKLSTLAKKYEEL